LYCAFKAGEMSFVASELPFFPAGPAGDCAGAKTYAVSSCTPARSFIAGLGPPLFAGSDVPYTRLDPVEGQQPDHARPGEPSASGDAGSTERGFST
jgi:hypothetical protein